MSQKSETADPKFAEIAKKQIAVRNSQLQKTCQQGSSCLSRRTTICLFSDYRFIVQEIMPFSRRQPSKTISEHNEKEQSLPNASIFFHREKYVGDIC